MRPPGVPAGSGLANDNQACDTVRSAVVDPEPVGAGSYPQTACVAPIPAHDPPSRIDAPIDEVPHQPPLNVEHGDLDIISVVHC